MQECLQGYKEGFKSLKFSSSFFFASVKFAEYTKRNLYKFLFNAFQNVSLNWPCFNVFKILIC